MAMIKWIVTTSVAYRGLQEKDINALYFLKDTQEIYKGAQSFTQSAELVERFPERPAQGRIYIDKTTLEGRVWVNEAWKTVIHPIAESLTDEVSETKAVSGNAIKKYVTDKVTAAVKDQFVDGISYNKDSKQLTYTKGSKSASVGIEGFVTNARYDGSLGKLSFDVQGGNTIDITLPKDNFVKSGKYDKQNKQIVLEMVNGPAVVIPAADLIDDTEFANTNTVNMNVSPEGVVTANVRVSETGDNTIQVKEDGLYVAPTNLDGKLDKVTRERANEIIMSNADGSVRVSGLKAGGETLGADPTQNTLATESAVAAIRTALSDQISTKINISDISRTIPEEAQASDNKVASEKAVATAIDALKGEKIDKTNISNKIDQTTISEDKVVSEKAVVAALSWVELN